MRPIHSLGGVATILHACLLFLAPARPARADLLLNEVLYDPAGTDEGLEFVELWNPDSLALSLGGIVVEVCDGARPGAWTAAFVGSPADSVPARGPYLIAGASLLVPIQNGPDAVRVTRGGLVLDLLGYGEFLAPELREGAPAPDVASGESLARRGDGADTGWNASDWASEQSPTPGRANHPDVRLAFLNGSARVQPEVSWPGESVAVTAFVKNLGRVEVDGARWRADVLMNAGASTQAATGAWPGDSGWSAEPATVCRGTALAPGESAAVECRFLAPPPGPFAIRIALRDLLAPGRAPGDFADPAGGIADSVTIVLRSTAGPLVINEFAFRDRGAGEWVEVLAREAVPDLGAFALTDAGGALHAIDRGSTPRGARAGEIFVVAESPASLRPAFALPESVVMGCRGGWPALNDADADDGVADRVRIIGPGGIPSDAVPYSSDYSARGGALERLGPEFPSASAATWAESIDPRGGTAGLPNSMRAAEEGSGRHDALLVASARSVRREPGSVVVPVVLRLTEGARGKRIRVRVRDLLGRTRRVLLDGQRVLGESAFMWDGRDDEGGAVPAGIYVVCAETVPDGRERATTASLPLAVVERWPR